jgi:ATP-dependent DNA helicase DinG
VEKSSTENTSAKTQTDPKAKAKTKSTLKPLHQAIDKLTQSGFDRREGQIQMMEAIWKALQKKNIGIIEGGTGIGKTFAYLTAALTYKPEHVKIIVATATVTLQEQLIQKDIPTLVKALDRPIHAALAKGRRRYICVSRLSEAALSPQQDELSLFGIDAKKSNTKQEAQQEQKVCQTLLKQYQSDSDPWDGDLDQLDNPPESTLKHRITTDSAGCGNKRCQAFSQCAYFKSRRKLYGAELVITNHDLFLSDLALGSGVLLPKIEDCIVIIDEAHHFNQKAVERFSSQIYIQGTLPLLKNLHKYIVLLGQTIDLDKQILHQSQDLSQKLSEGLKSAYQFIDANYNQFSKNDYWLLPDLPEAIRTLLQPLVIQAYELMQILTKTRKMLNDSQSTQPIPEYDNLLAYLGSYTQRIQNLYQLLSLFCKENPINQPPIVRWISKTNSKKTDYIIQAAVSSAATLLPTYFWDKLKNGAILCSATLRSMDSFTHYLEKSGLNYYKNCITQAFQSPFNYAQSHLNLVQLKHMPQGQDAENHTKEVTKWLQNNLPNFKQGTLVLFTSKWMLESTYSLMSNSLQTKIFKQGNQSRQQILTQHKHCIDQNKSSIIFGLQSFGEGVDLPGNYCKQLIITKLPFAVPNTPIEKTWVNYLSQLGRNAFIEHTLPQASLRLTQYAGRLIRTEEDTGTLYILDPRIQKKFYGKALLANLPKFTMLT